MTDLTHDLPDGRLKRFELWIHRNRVRLLSWGFVAMFLVSVAAGYLGWHATQETKDLAKANRALIQRVATVDHTGRDQACAADEREHLRNVDALKRTYLVLESPTSRAELGPGLVRAIVTMLPQAENLARNDQAPEICDDPGLGLPEPDPVPPKRKDFSYLLAPSNDP